jgi:hypothetical protein
MQILITESTEIETSARAIADSDGIIRDELGDSFTPVPADLLDLFDDPRWPNALRRIWAHTANVELRAMNRIGTQPDFAALRDKMLELIGREGNNGKIGQLRKDIDGVLSRAWWFLTVCIGGIGAAAVKLIIVGRAYGELETQVRANRDRVGLLEAVLFHLPAPLPEKAPPP